MKIYKEQFAKAKNIWILNHYAVSPDMPGGTRHYDLSKELVKKGHVVTIFTSGFDYNTKKYIKIRPKERVKIEDYNGVRFVWLNTVPYYNNDWRRVLNMISYGVRVLGAGNSLEKPDVVIGSSVHPFAVLAGWWLAKKYKAKFIFEVRDLWPQTLIDMKAIRASSLIARMLYTWEKFMYKKAKKIIVLLPKAKEYIKKHGIDDQKIIWIPNGVDLERFDSPELLDKSSEVAKAFVKYKNKFKVVYTGAHGPANGLEVVIDAAYLLFKKSIEVHFFLIGDGTERKNLIQKARQKNIDNITFIDPVPKSQIPSILQQSDLLLICLKRLGVYKYGISMNKMYDYLASEKPIIMSSDIDDNVIKSAKAGIVVEPENPEALAEGVIKIKKMSQKERQQFGNNGRSYVEKYHNIKELAKILEKVL